MIGGKILGGLAVLFCVAASATFAFEFGWLRGSSSVHQWTYALAAVALDLLKPALPVMAAAALATVPRQWAKVGWCWTGFGLLTSLSLLCAFGMTATQLAEKVAEKFAITSQESNRASVLDELRRQRRSLPSYMPLSDGGVITAQKVADTAAAQRLAECDASRGGRGAHCRDREADERLALAALAKAQTDKAITDQAAALDAKIAAAEGALSQVDMRAAHREADPQSAALASLTGYDQTKVAAILQIVLAVAVEFGSGVGFWLVFGHGPRRRHEDDVPMFAADSD